MLCSIHAFLRLIHADPADQAVPHGHALKASMLYSAERTVVEVRAVVSTLWHSHHFEIRKVNELSG